MPEIVMFDSIYEFGFDRWIRDLFINSCLYVRIEHHRLGLKD
jgi:hypothetical protein